MRKLVACALIAGLVLSAAGAAAQSGSGCWRNGVKHPEGSRVGGYTCRNGSWER